ncbi:MAG: ATP-binding cassette domain-containing protein [Hydrogenophaga sp.]|uniref:ABC transporter ATP-binding protein n=1 Tax=Hydrogenophaga sp. TaxID=1904254 RepID=UPI0016AA0D7B|nr:ABC transporter ATP-binding protein [Hydrogenophaga sp.]NIM41698.1 ATP-binding cassette domain-containing protein [Hydrogenophaga sp.]NIN27003.1 ATP-binding cassette domain-containing protein [Hydrogenophaga sp.]NIN31704.1 ATP-binding cassette domain-containing protein [Hydrogenophaga sp.]NIN55948.1 ATP-binding cassette domain-containing protein [Hydrogenophaga sp.]NIO52075.1 ATP-binding cassette domain-containing protein [Hydrogenophaga sp.]
MTPENLRLELTGITKRYPGVVANDGVSLRVRPGEIHAVLGENGAGKSTLMKVIYGAAKPDEGTVRFNGQTVHVRNPQEARALGISMVFQHFSLFDSFTVAENVWLGLESRSPGRPKIGSAPRGEAARSGASGGAGASVSLAQVREQVRAKAGEYGLDVDPERPVHTLSVGEMQRVEIIRALLTNPQLLILDEPTSVLTPQAVEKLFVVLRQLAAEGCSILYISHKLHEIRELCTACTVLRGGKVTGVCDPREESNASLSRLMIGAEPPELTHRPLHAGEPVLQVRALTLASDDPFGTALHEVGLTVRAGEVVGIAGVSGNGQGELLRALSGEDVRAPAGSVRLGDRDASALGPAKRRALGLHFVPEERLGRGAVPTLSLAQNLLLSRRDAVGRGGWVRVGALRRQAADIIARYQVKANGPDAAAKSLSGGNLQKFIVGREIEAKPKLLILSQPTWGVDVGASAQIRGEILALRDAGCAVLVVSEELEELFEISDRLHVIAKGRLSPSLDRADATVERIGEWMSGLWEATQNNEKETAHAAA